MRLWIRPCCHKTEQEAEECFLKWQAEQFDAGLIEPEDLIIRHGEQLPSKNIGDYVV
jgi:hypothetical protein